jgi:hypothetical protein
VRNCERKPLIIHSDPTCGLTALYLLLATAVIVARNALYDLQYMSSLGFAILGKKIAAAINYSNLLIAVFLL